MDLKWLEDFLALVEHGSFTRAASARFISQPAFSRRIRALENWLGVELIDRDAYPTRLTAMGEEFVPAIREMVEETYRLRSEMRGREARIERLVVSTQHCLSVTLFPQWYSEIQHLLRGTSVRLKARNLHDCVEQFLTGQSDLLLCYSSQDPFPELERVELERLTLGNDPLIPVGTPTLIRETADKALPLIGFPSGSFFGDLIRRECLSACQERDIEFDPVFETASSESARALALQHVGVTWLPASLVHGDIEAGLLVRPAMLAEAMLTTVMMSREPHTKPALRDVWAYMLESRAATAA